MTLKVIEGSWDEILLHASELQGHRLRVIVCPNLRRKLPRVKSYERL